MTGEREQHSLYFIYWTGGGMPPVGASGQTIGAFSLDELMERVAEKLGRRTSGLPVVAITDVPIALWPSLEDFEEDMGDAA